LEPGSATDWQSPELRTRLLGKHQRDNLALVAAAVLLLRQQGWSISDTALQAGVAAAQPAGRLQIIRQQPQVIVDVAHNPASIAALIETLQQLEVAADKALAAPAAAPGTVAPTTPVTGATAVGTPVQPTAAQGVNSAFRRRRRTLVFAVSRDKDFTTMLGLVARYFDHVILTRFHQNPRATELTTLTETLARVTDPLRPVTCESVDQPAEAYQAALAQSGPEDWVVVAGSLFLLAEIGSWNNGSADVE
jgi:dihydrofolate synthase/folylpolyglutamate synthase